MFQQLLDILLKLFVKENITIKPVEVEEVKEVKEVIMVNTINWLDTNSKISKYFTVREALWLPSWAVLHTPSEQEKENILKIAIKMDAIRELACCPLIVHCWLRPSVANCPNSKHDKEDYNKAIGGAPGSMHRLGSAVDFHAASLSCEEMKKLLIPKLEEWGLRLEDNGAQGSWVHIDDKKVAPGGVRFFKP